MKQLAIIYSHAESDDKDMKYTVNNFVEDIINKYKKPKNEDISPEERLILDNTLDVYEKIQENVNKEPDYVPLKMEKIEPYVPVIWPEEKIFNTYYQKKYLKSKHKNKYSTKIEFSETLLKYENVKAKAYANEITNLDLKIIKLVHPTEFLDYDDNEEAEGKCKWLSFLKHKNYILENMIGEEIKNNNDLSRYFIKVSEELYKQGNYNSLNCLLNGIKRNQLNNEDFKDVSDLMNKMKNYFEIRKLLDEKKSNKEFFICPLDVVLKGLLDIKANKQSEIASKHFCELIEFFVMMQNEKTEIKSRKKVEHFLYYKMNNFKNFHIKRVEKEEVVKKLGSLFLFL